MELRKIAKANLQTKRPLFYIWGIIMATSLTLVAFEYRSPEVNDIFVPYHKEPIINDTFLLIPKPPTPPKVNSVKAIVKVIPNPDVLVIKPDVPDTASTFTPSAPGNPTDGFITETDGITDDTTTNPLEISQIQDFPYFKNCGALHTQEEQMACLNTGLANHLLRNLRYPEYEKTIGLEGKVYVEFVITKDASIADVKILRGISTNCDNEVIRVVQRIQNLVPAKNNGRPVSVRFRLPVEFRTH